MESKITLTSAVMLETQWSARKKDILELITPFVEYCVAETTSLHSQIDVQKIILKMHRNFGYVDIPESIIYNVFRRHRDTFIRQNKNYYLTTSLDDVVTHFNQQRRECEDHIETIGKSLYEYLSLHCQHEKVYNQSMALQQLHNFFVYFGIDISLDRLSIDSISRKNTEIYYYIARYIIEMRSQNSYAYKKILALVKGYYLETALYLQPDNGNLMSASYKNIIFYYDTPFLLQLLGYQSRQEERKAQQLHKMLQQQKAKFRFFPQTRTEIFSILTAYGYSLNSKNVSTRTLEGLDFKHYTSSDVDRLKDTFQDRLYNEFDIELTGLPSYPTKSDGSVVESSVVSEKEIATYILSKMPHYKDDSLQADIESVVAIHKLRNGNIYRNIEDCTHLFVTTNIDFVNAFNSYYRKEVQKDTFDLAIDTGKLSAITWIKSNNIDENMPELQLLENAYSAQQPLPELIEKMTEILNKMETEGKISYEEVVSIRTSHFTKKEILLNANGQPDNITENFVEQIREKFKEDIIGQAKADAVNTMKELYKQQDAEKEKEIRHKTEQAAREFAYSVKAAYLRRTNTLVISVSVIIIILGILGCILSSSWQWNIPWLIFMITSILSIYDTVKSRQSCISKWIDKAATVKESEAFDLEYKKYMKIYESDRHPK